MPIQIVEVDEQKKWDELVKDFINYDVSYLNGYSKAFQSQGNSEPLLFYYNDLKGTKAINVIMKQDIALTKNFIGKIPMNTWFDFSTPYGYGGFLIEGRDYDSVNKSFHEYCVASGCVSEFVRFHLLNNYQELYDGISESKTQNIIRHLELPLDEMLMDFEHKVRKSLKKAAKADLSVEFDYTGKRLDEFLNIYYGTMERNSANEKFYFSKDFFELINKMENHYVYIHILLAEKIISTELVLYGPQNCYSFLGGTDKEYLKLQPNTLLKYEIIKWAKSKKLKNFILGGGYGSNDGIYKYKKSFAPKGIYDYYSGKKIINDEKYNELLEINKRENMDEENITFFPEYRVET